MLLINNISVLFTGNINNIINAAVLIDKNLIYWYGPEQNLPKVNIKKIINAQNKLVIPGLIDCHTHLLFAGERAQEFAKRIDGHTYAYFLVKNKGIEATIKATKEASDQELLILANNRLNALLAQGVTTVEIKSGYGLSFYDEIRLLNLINQLDKNHKIDIHRTFLGAHKIPKKYINKKEKYIEIIINEMLPYISQNKLADDCDVFCEKGAFGFGQALKILKKAHDLGFGLRAHVQQLGYSAKGVKLVQEVPIKSISHADFLKKEDIAIIANNKIIVEALPFAALFLRSKKITPVKKLKEQGVNLALATDFNPGSAMCHDLILAARLGVTYFGFSLVDALLAITKNAAKALGRNNIGIIKNKAQADLLVTNYSSIPEFFYDWAKQPVYLVIKNGKLEIKNPIGK